MSESLPPVAENPVAVPENPADPAVRLAELEKDYGTLQEKYEQLHKQSILEKISMETGCTDPGYLEYRAGRQGIDLGDPAAVRAFARELSAHSPGCFRARITPGSSAGSSVTNPPSGGQDEGICGDRIGLIARCIGDAPEAVGR
ncbi:MAG: hypothetical protein J6S43_02490 [Lentisphaeria bacterium]|nr:hypothetical protein [Lentisphaeria bacterium]